MTRSEPLLELSTPRLSLLALARPQLKTALENKRRLVARPESKLCRRAVERPGSSRALAAKLTKMARAPEHQHLWFSYWLIVLPQQATGIGLLGFKGSPNARAEVEIGYGVAPAFRGAGYASEAARTLVNWALDQTVCSTVTAEVAKDNAASRRVLEKLGMKLVKTSGGTYKYETFDRYRPNGLYETST